VFTPLADRAELLEAQLLEAELPLLAGHAWSLQVTLRRQPAEFAPVPVGLTFDPSMSVQPATWMPADGPPVVVWDDPNAAEQIEWPLLVLTDGRLLLGEFPGYTEPRPGVTWPAEIDRLRLRLASLDLFARQTTVMGNLTEWLASMAATGAVGDVRRRYAPALDRATTIRDTYLGAFDAYTNLTLGVVEDYARRLLEDTHHTGAAVRPIRFRKD